MLKFYCFLTGDDYNIVKDSTPLSIKKIKLYAIGLIIPVILWAVQSYLLVTEVMRKDIPTAILVMIVCVVLIFAIEKSIIMSNGSKYIAVFRVILGLTIAVIGSIILDEVVFKNDIDVQFADDKRESIENSMESIKNDLNVKIMAKENEVMENKEQWEKAELDAIKEADGTAGTGIPNVGRITQLKLQKAEEKRGYYQRSSIEMNSMIISKDSVLKAYEEKLSNSYSDASLLLRIKALFNLIGKDGAMKWSYIIFTLFIVLLESMVVIIKLCSSDTNYEKKMKMIEKIGEKRMNLILDNNSSVFDPIIFKSDIQQRTEILRKPMNGVYR